MTPPTPAALPNTLTKPLPNSLPNPSNYNPRPPPLPPPKSVPWQRATGCSGGSRRMSASSSLRSSPFRVLSLHHRHFRIINVIERISMSVDRDSAYCMIAFPIYTNTICIRRYIYYILYYIYIIFVASLAELDRSSPSERPAGRRRALRSQRRRALPRRRRRVQPG